MDKLDKMHDVARQIAKGRPPPVWLEPALEHFLDYIAGTGELGARELRDYVRDLIRAVKTLQRLLPAFNHLPLGLRPPADVTKCLEALPGILRALRPDALKPHRGQPPNTRKAMCASVVAVAWRLLHGTVALRSDDLAKACNAYWLACGCPDATDNPVDHWRGYLAQSQDHERIGQIEFIGEVMEGYRQAEAEAEVRAEAELAAMVEYSAK
jgi:hypothetical protein